MCTSRLGKEVVLVAGCLQVLVSGSLYVLSPWDLNLNVWSVGSLLGQMLLLASRAVEVLSGLIHKLIGRCTTHSRQVYVLGRAPTC